MLQKSFYTMYLASAIGLFTKMKSPSLQSLHSRQLELVRNYVYPAQSHRRTELIWTRCSTIAAVVNMLRRVQFTF